MDLLTDIQLNAAQYARMDDGAEIAFRRWTKPKSKRIIISHGNGLAIDGFWKFGMALASEFEVIAFDLRNHGQSPRSPHPANPWPRYIADIPYVFDAISEIFGKKETHGAFHSMAAASTLIAQSLTPRPWATLTLFEPPIPAATRPNLVADFNERQCAMAGRARRRRRYFTDPKQLADSFKRADSFSGICDLSLDLLARGSVYCSDASPEEPWELVLSPDNEARNFDAGILSDYWENLGSVETAVQLIVGDPATHDMPNLPEIAAEMAASFGFPITSVPETNHFMQLQNPGLCAQHIFDFAR
ncbi:alpha/beta fold hydrolase [Paracoccus onubensis]|nr:alpha/beta hydrolase [Paracoccus onubensis]